MKIVPYHADHFDDLLDNMRDPDISNISPKIEDRAEMVETIKFYETHGMLLTFMTDDNKVAAIFCAMLKWQGVSEIWAAVTPEVDKNIVGFQRACWRAYFSFIDSHDPPLHRIEAIVHSKHIRSMKWLHRLGFKMEALMKQYGINKEDYVLMARIIK